MISRLSPGRASLIKLKHFPSALPALLCGGLLSLASLADAAPGDIDLTMQVFGKTSGTPIVESTAAQIDNQIIVVGDFDSYDGVTRNNILRLYPEPVSPGGPGGILDTTFDPNLDGPAANIVIQNDEKILVAGSFTTVGGSSQARLARLNKDGSLDTSFTPVFNGSVYATAIQRDNKILVCGTFTTVNGTSRSRIARLNTDGTLDTSFNANITGGTVRTMHTLIDDKILIGGSGIYVNFVNKGSAAKLQTSGSLDTGFTLSGSLGPIIAASVSGDIYRVSFANVQTSGYQILTVNTSNGNLYSGFTGYDYTQGGTQPGTIFTSVCGFHAAGNVSGSGDSAIVRFGLGQPHETYPLTTPIDTFTLLRNGYAIIGGDFSSSGERVARVVLSNYASLTDNVKLEATGSNRFQWPVGVSIDCGFYDYSDDSGATWSPVTGVNGNNYDYGFIENVTLPRYGLLRVRGGTLGGKWGMSRSLVEDILPLEADIEIQGNNIPIAHEDSTPSATDHTSFGAPAVAGASVTRTFKIRNKEHAHWEVTEITVSGPHADDFRIGTLKAGGLENASLPYVLGNNALGTFEVIFQPRGPGTRSATVHVQTSDLSKPDYTFAIEGSATTEINVKDAFGNNITDGSTSFSDDGRYLGAATNTQTRSSTFTIQNSGTGGLNISFIDFTGPAAAEFSVGYLSYPIYVPAGGQVPLTVFFTSTIAGLREATINITNDDSDESNYDFTLRATGAWVYDAATDIPVTSSNPTLSGDVGFVLNFAPNPATILTVVNNTGTSFINTRYYNLEQGQQVKLDYNGHTYAFVANYYGGDGNDLVLQWAHTRPFGWGLNTSKQIGDNSATSRTSPVSTSAIPDELSPTIVQIATGGHHTIALSAKGYIYSWGYNAYRQLGDGSTTGTNRGTPFYITSPALSGKTVVAVAAGLHHSLALCSDGTVYSWGRNQRGQGGTGTTSAYNATPVAVNTSSGSALYNKTVVRIISGPMADHSFAQCSDGTWVAWGYNDDTYRCLGTGATVDIVSLPQQLLLTGALSGKTIIDIAAGELFTLALCSDETTVAAWGLNTSGQLGNGSTTTSATPVGTNLSPLLAGGETIWSLAAGGAHALALRSDGRVISWGANNIGQLGKGSTSTSSSTPALVEISTGSDLAGKTVTAIAAGDLHSYALCSDGNVTAWGENANGRLGLGNTTDSSLPKTVVEGAMNNTQNHISLQSGVSHGQTLVAGPQGILQVMHDDDFVQDNSNLYLDEDDTIIDWGVTYFGTGVLGKPKQFILRNAGGSPLTISAIYPPFNWSSNLTLPKTINQGDSIVVTLSYTPTSNSVDGDDVVITYNTSGFSESQFRIPVTGTGTNTSIPALYNDGSEIPLITNSAFSATGKSITFDLNFPLLDYPELTVVQHNGPGFISGRFNDIAQGGMVTLVYNGAYYNYLADYFGGDGNDLVLIPVTDRRLVTWGNNQYGETGRTEYNWTVSLPHPMEDEGALTGKTVTRLACGSMFSIALCSDGTLAAWGRNSGGQLGQGTQDLDPHPIPLAIATGSGTAFNGQRVIAISAGPNHVLALREDGKVVAWGAGMRLGNNSDVTTGTPTLVDTSSSSALYNRSVVMISAGEDHNLALCSDGRIAAWGGGPNSSTALGYSTTPSYRKLPVLTVITTSLSGRSVIAIAAGYGSSFALCSDGTVHSWGMDTSKQLGDSNVSLSRATPGLVDATAGSALFNQKVLAISARVTNALALCEDRSTGQYTLASWGRYVGLGDASYSTTDRAIPVKVNTRADLGSQIAGKSIRKFIPGPTAAVVCSDKTLALWGNNNDGLVGANDYLEGWFASPQIADRTTLSLGERFAHVALGSEHGVAIVEGPPGPSIVAFTNLGGNSEHYYITSWVTTITYPTYWRNQNTITLRNTGTQTLSNISITLSGPNPEAFILDTTGTATTLAPGETTTIYASHNPAEAIYQGQTAEILIESNIYSEEPYVIPLYIDP